MTTHVCQGRQKQYIRPFAGDTYRGKHSDRIVLRVIGGVVHYHTEGRGIMPDISVQQVSQFNRWIEKSEAKLVAWVPILTTSQLGNCENAQ